MSDELIRLSAVAAVQRLRRGEVSPLELLDAAAARIQATDGALNALPILCLERARAQARRLSEHSPGDPGPGWLAGLPIAVKDLNPVAGVRCTYGSPIYAKHIPQRSDALVDRLEARGAVVIAKSNTPEFGAGASTFNEVFGRTHNPWNLGRSVAGSSGGSAAALAAGQVWLATGSDLGGSLRTPASFNGVVGLRPTPGRVPHAPTVMPWNSLSVNGPMARSVADTALFLDAMAGVHPEDPLSLAAPDRDFQSAVAQAEVPARLAYTPDLGLFPVDREVAELCLQAVTLLAGQGTQVEQAAPDLHDAMDCFQSLRAALFAAGHLSHYREHKDLLKPEVVWNIEKGLQQPGETLADAEVQRGEIHRRMLGFLGQHALLACPTALVPPFPVEWRYVEEANGQRFATYLDWIGITAVFSLSGCPALSVPVGLTASGLPVGLQLIAPPRQEANLLAAGAALEQLIGFPARLPVDPRNGD